MAFLKKTANSYATKWRGREVHTTDTRKLPLMTLWLSADRTEVWLAGRTLTAVSKAGMLPEVIDHLDTCGPGITVLPSRFFPALDSDLASSAQGVAAISEVQLLERFSDLAATAARRGDSNKAMEYYGAAASLMANVERALSDSRAMMEITASMVAAAH